MVGAAGLLAAKPPDWGQAFDLYQRTNYQASLKLLEGAHEKDADTLQLIGQDHYMLGQYKKATEDFDKALALDSTRSWLCLWAGRAWGRRAETSNPFSAPGYASRARKLFEKAVELDLSNRDAVGDLFDYYMGAPGVLGGGLDHAQDLVQRVAGLDPAEGDYLQAQIDEKRKDFDKAEQHLRRARELAPKQVGRIIDLARFLAKRGRNKESDALFDQAETMAPQSPRVLFSRAEIYVQQKRNLEAARNLLERYMNAPLTPDDPPRERARELLAQTRP